MLNKLSNLDFQHIANRLLMCDNSSEWLENKCPGTERNCRRTSHSKRELYFSEVVVEVLTGRNEDQGKGKLSRGM